MGYLKATTITLLNARSGFTSYKVVSKEIILCLPFGVPIAVHFTACRGPGVPCLLVYHWDTKVVQKPKQLDVCTRLGTCMRLHEYFFYLFCSNIRLVHPMVLQLLSNFHDSGWNYLLNILACSVMRNKCCSDLAHVKNSMSSSLQFHWLYSNLIEVHVKWSPKSPDNYSTCWCLMDPY